MPMPDAALVLRVSRSRTGLRTKLVSWVLACLLAAVIIFGEVWLDLPRRLSPEVLQASGVFHWGALGLCVIWLLLKRDRIAAGLRGQARPFSRLFGLFLLMLSILTPRTDYAAVFLMLLGFLGLFIIVFGRGFALPAALLAVYGFSLAFPVLATAWLGESSAGFTAGIVRRLAGLMGLPLNAAGLTLRFTSLTGAPMSVVVTPGCA
ncbi:MAG: hypothetical protein HYX96_05715, partial [Chloroflexi bacterium]|nr:hypothetical protein [Chloroflexota bacterium]